MVTVPDSRLEESGFESRCQQVACSFQPALASVEGKANNTSMQSSTKPWPQSPTGPKESISKEVVLVNYVQGVLRISGSKIAAERE